MTEENQKSRAFRKKHVIVNDRMQRGYRYELSAPMGRNFDPDFNPGANISVNCIVVQADGKIVVGGGFITLDGNPRSRIGRSRQRNPEP